MGRNDHWRENHLIKVKDEHPSMDLKLTAGRVLMVSISKP